MIHLTPRAHTAWHTHPNGQTICVMEGIAHAHRPGGSIETVYPRERDVFEPGEDHWDGAAPTAV